MTRFTIFVSKCTSAVAEKYFRCVSKYFCWLLEIESVSEHLLHTLLDDEDTSQVFSWQLLYNNTRPSHNSRIFKR